MKVTLATISIVTCLGCSWAVTGLRDRGQLALVSTRAIPSYEGKLTIGEVEGKGCFGIVSLVGSDKVVEEAFTDAMREYPDADALTDVSVRDTGDCIRVKGSVKAR